jgi:sugar phosphate isomerase/epimerase
MSAQLTFGRWPIGVADVCFKPRVDAHEAARIARDHGFSHLDLHSHHDERDSRPFAIPIGSRTVNTGNADVELSEVVFGSPELSRWPRPRPGWGYVPPPMAYDGAWDFTIRTLRECPAARVEPWWSSVVATNEQIRALLEAVPGLRLIVDVSQTTYLGEDPYELFEFADLVQLRDAAPGKLQLPVGEGTVDFSRVRAELERLEFDGQITIEYFDLPWVGHPLDTPWEWTVDLARHLNEL